MLPISKTDFSKKYWKKVPNFNFAATQAICAITRQELPKVLMEMPIGFVKNEESFVLVAVLGLHNDSNLFVDSSGRWTQSYIPAFYRSYPFVLATTDAQDERLVLCIDEESGLLSEDSNDQAFFDSSGELDEFLQSVVTLLEAVQIDRKSTIELCSILQEHDLIQPWDIEIKYDNGVHRVEGLYRIDEAKFNDLSDEAFLELRHSGALQIVNCQLLSIPNIFALISVVQTLGSSTQDATPAELDFGSLSDSGNLNLDNL